MATTLYLTSTASPLGGSGQKALSTSRGSASTTAVTNTTASGTSIPVTATAGGTALTWWYQVGAGTISGNVTANIRGKESSTSANAGAGIIVDLYQSDGTTLIGNLLTSTAPATITEYSTSDAAKALASTAISSQKATNGCWVKVTLTVRNVGTMATAFTVTNTYSGPSSGAAGDTSITFATTLPAYVAPSMDAPYVASTGVPISATATGALSVPVPKGVTAGDLIILALGAEWNSTSLPDATSVSVSGFTVAQVTGFQSYTSYAETNLLLYKYATGADTGTYSVTFNTVGGGSVTQIAGVASIVRNGPTAGNPFVDSFQTSHSVGSTSVSVSSFTPSGANTLLFGVTWCDDTVPVSTYPSGWVNQANTSTGNGIMIATLQQTSAVATGTLTWGMASGSPDPVVAVGAIRAKVSNAVPQVVGSSGNGIGYVSGSFTVNLPANSVKYLAFTEWDTDIASGILPPPGWTEVAYKGVDASGNHISSVYSALASGSPGTSWNVPTASGSNNSAAVLIIGYDRDFDVVASAWASTAPAPALTPTYHALAVRDLATWQNVYTANYPYPSSEPYGHAQFLQSSATNIVIAHSEVAANTSSGTATWAGAEVDSTATLLLVTKLPAPFAAYNFDENSGTIVHDQSGNGYNLTATGSPWTSSGYTNSGLATGSSGGYFSGSFGTGTLGAWSVAFWYYHAGNPTSTYGQFMYDGVSFEAEVTSSNTIDFGGAFYSPTLSTGSWYHVSFAYDGSTLYGYINGVAFGNTTVSGYTIDRASTWSIGSDAGRDNGAPTGRMDDVQFFGSMLTAGQLLALSEIPLANVQAPTISTTTLGPLTQNIAYSLNLIASGSATWSVASGTLPGGLTLTSGGLLSGTPSSYGSYNFTLTATNSAGSSNQTYSGTIGISHLVRNKTVYQTSGTTITATFTETAALDSTYLLVAIVNVGSATAISTPSGWTAVSGNGNNTTAQVCMYTKQGDGTTNSVSVTIPSASATLTLVAYSGFSSLTPIGTDGGASIAQGSSYDAGPIAPNSYPGFGVLIQALGVTGTVTWNSWTTLTRIGNSTGSTALADPSQLMTAAYREFDGAIGTGDISISWVGSKSSREMGLIMPLTNTIPTEVASYSFDENTGTSAADSSGNGYTATVTNWTTGHTNSAAVGDGSHSAMHASATFISSPTTATMMTWYKPAVGFTGQDVGMLSADGANASVNRFGIGFNSGSVIPYAWTYNSSSTFKSATGTTSLSVGTWYHLTAVLDTSTISIYVNGVLQGSAPWSGSISTALAYLEAGGITAYGEYNVGAVDDVRAYSSALTQWQIIQLMNTPVSFSGTVAGPTWWGYGGQQLTPYLLTMSGLQLLGASSTMTKPVPVIISQSAANASGYGSMYSPSVTTDASTSVGDLVIIVGYVEPYNEGTVSATYGNFTLPTGVTLASGFPLETNPAQVTTGNDHRMYVWYYYATAPGSTTLTFTNDQQIYWGLASVTIRGGPTSGNPFADTPSTATVSTSASGITSTPPVSLTLGGPNSLVLWAYTDWNGSNPGYPSGISDAAHASNEAGQPAIGYATYTAAGSTGTISAVRSNNDQGMIAALLSFRAP